MSQQNIDFGSFPNDQNADAIRVAFQKVQNNFTELYSVIYQTGVSKILPGPGISVDQNTGNVTVTNRLNSLTVQTGNSLRVGISTASSNVATVNSSTTPLVINVSNTITTNTIVATSNLVGRLSANSANQPNITNVGTLTTLSVSGNVRANLFIGNVTSTYINATAIDAPGANTQLLYNQQGNIGALSVLSFNSNTSTLNLTGLISATSNITGANLRTGGSVSATGNVRGGNIFTLGNVSANGNIIANVNLRANGTITTLGNGTFANVRTSGIVSAAGNVIGDWFVGSLANGTSRINIPTANSNIGINVNGVSNVVTIAATGANISGNLNVSSEINTVDVIASGLVDAAGDIEAGGDLRVYGNAYVQYQANLGNVSTNRIIATGNIQANNLNLSGVINAGNISGNNSTLAGNLSVGNVGPITYNPPAVLYANGSLKCTNINGNGTLSIPTISSTGNITGANFIGNGTTLANLTGANVIGNVAQATESFRAANIVTAGSNQVFKFLLCTQNNNGDGSFYYAGPTFNPQFGLLTTTNFNASANVTANGIVGTTLFSGNLNAGSNVASGNITGNWQLTPGSRLTATYADLAENYAGDQFLDPGYVVEFGGENEVTLCLTPNSTKVAGVVSTDPAYVMNGMIKCIYPVSVALQGRVPTKVTGKISKGDLMVSAGNGLATACSSPIIGSVIGKSLENFEGSLGTIEIAIGRL